MSTIDKETTSPKPEDDTKTSKTEMMISVSFVLVSAIVDMRNFWVLTFNF